MGNLNTKGKKAKEPAGANPAQQEKRAAVHGASSSSAAAPPRKPAGTKDPLEEIGDRICSGKITKEELQRDWNVLSCPGDRGYRMLGERLRRYEKKKQVEEERVQVLLQMRGYLVEKKTITELPGLAEHIRVAFSADDSSSGSKDSLLALNHR